MIFLGKGNIHCLFFYLIKPKRRHTSGAVFIRPKNALCTIDGAGGGMPKGQQRILVKKGPHFWALALAFVVQLATSLSVPLEWGAGGGRTGGAPRAGGAICLQCILGIYKVALFS